MFGTFPGRLLDIILWATGATRRKLLLLPKMWNADSIEMGKTLLTPTVMIFKKWPWDINNLFQGVKLLSLPRILCISFKRFRVSRNGTRKLNCTVTFPESFDFAEVAKEAFSPSFTQVRLFRPLASVCGILTCLILSLQSDCRYKLFAVVVHSGFAMCGHYTAFVRHPSDQHWYHANDSHVKRVKPYFTCKEERVFYSSLWSLLLWHAGFLGGNKVSIWRTWQVGPYRAKPVQALFKSRENHHRLCDLSSKGCSRPPEGDKKKHWFKFGTLAIC